MKPIRIVLDTNVYIAAVLNPESVIYRIVDDSAVQYLAQYFTSPAILAELQDMLENKLGLPRNQIVRWITQLERAVTVIRPTQVVTILNARDPRDNKMLECALGAAADADLLDLKQFHDTKIIHTSTVKFLFPQLKH